MSRNILLTQQQIEVINTALKTAPPIDEVDGYDDNVQRVLIDMFADVLTFPDTDEMVHDFNL